MVADIYSYFQEQFLLHPYHFYIETLLFVFIVYLFFQKSYKPHKHAEKLTPQEEDQLINEWTPIPLVPPMDPDLLKQTDEGVVIGSEPGPYLTIGGKKLLNLGTTNFLGLTDHPEVKAAAKDTIVKYGVGTCGPRGFYGTLDTHLDLEKRLAKFMGTEECIIYSAGFATVSSAIPAFSGREDLIFCDEGVHYSLHLGATLSRSEVKYYKHNDMDDLEKKLEEMRQTDIKTRRKIRRRFVVVEGLSCNYGDILPLKRLMELKNKYKVRIIMDDSYGIGVLGKTGRGTCEHFGIPPSEIEVLCSSMGNSLGSIGGFCVGSYQVVYHQRLNSSGYVFSASSPPYLVVAVNKAVDLIDQSPSLLSSLAGNISFFRSHLEDQLSKQQLVVIQGDKLSPVIHLRSRRSTNQGYSKQHRLEDEKLFHALVHKMIEGGVAATVQRYTPAEKFPPPPSIKLCVNNELSEEELGRAVKVIASAITSVA